MKLNSKRNAVLHPDFSGVQAREEQRGFGTDVTSFGADATGSRDSTEAFLKAIEKVKAWPGGGVVLIPNGLYRITETLRLSDFITLCGESRATVLDFSNQQSGSGIEISGYGNLGVENLQIRNPAGNGIEIHNVPGLPEFRNFCHICDVTVCQYEDQPQDRGGSGFAVENAYMSTFERCWASGMKDFGFYFAGFHTSIKFDTCWAEGGRNTGFFLIGMIYASLNNCGADANQGYGYFLANCQSLIMNGCGAEDNYYSSIGMATSDAWSNDWPSPVADLGVRGITVNSFFSKAGNMSENPHFGDYITLVAEDGRRIEGSSMNHVAFPPSLGRVVKRGFDPANHINFPVWQGTNIVG